MAKFLLMKELLRITESLKILVEDWVTAERQIIKQIKTVISFLMRCIINQLCISRQLFLILLQFPALISSFVATQVPPTEITWGTSR